MKKKILIGIVGIFALLIAALLAIPALYSIDDARPQIVEAINKQVNGEVSIDKLKLRLFPSLRFRMEGLKAKAKGYSPENWLELQSLDVDIALWTVLFQPKAKLIVNAPKIVILKGKEGKFNFEEFLAKPGAAAASPEKSAEESAGTPSGATSTTTADPKAILDSLPGFVKGLIYKARFGLALQEGAVQFSDPEVLAPGDKVSLDGLKFVMKNIGLDTPMEIDSSIGFDVKFGEIALKGPFEGKGTLQVLPVSKGIKLKLDLDESFDKTDLRFSQLFRKASGRALGAKFAGEITAEDGQLHVDLSNLELRLDKTRLGGKFKLANLSATSLGDLNLAMESNDIDMAGFGVLVPMVNDYALEGKVDLSLSALGSPLNPAVLVKVDLKNIGGSTPELKRPLKNLSGKIVVAGTPKSPSITVGPLTMGLGSSDIATNLTAKGLAPTKVEASVNSTLIDVDELLGLEALRLDTAAPTAKGAKETPPPAQKKGRKGKPAPLDESLTALAPVVDEALKNPALDLAELDFKGKIVDLVMLGATFSNIQSGLSYRGRTLKVSNAQLEAYDGKLLANVEIGLKNALSYSFSSSLTGVDFGEIMETHMPTWKSAISGSMTGSASISGVGLSKADLDKNLKGGLKGQIINGSFKLPLIKAVEAIANSMPKIAKGAKSAGFDASKSVKGSASGRFKTMDLDARIAGREVVLEKLDVEYDPKDLGGELQFNAKGTVDFNQKINLIGVVKIDPKLVPVDEIKALVGKSGLAEIPVKLKGTMEEPAADYEYTATYVGKKVLQDKALDAAASQAKKLIGEEKADAIADVLKDKKSPKKKLKDLKKLFK